MFLLSMIFDTSVFYGSYSMIYCSKNMKLRLKEAKANLSFIQSHTVRKNMEFNADADIFYGQKDEILIACNVHRLDL